MYTLIQSGKTNVKYILILIILSLIVGGGVFIYQDWRLPKQKVATSSGTNENLTPEEIVTDFLSAVQKRDKATARTFLSPIANTVAFKSTLENESSGLLYEKDFTFSITGSKLSANQKTSEVNVDIKIDNEDIKTVASLVREERGKKRWLLMNFEVLFSGEKLNRTNFLLYGPANFSMTNPSGESLGHGTGKAYLGDAKANYITGTDFKQITVTDLLGIWKMKIIGISDGTFTLYTEIVDKDNHQIGKIEGEISIGQALDYEIEYPLLKGTKIVVLPIERK